MRLTQGTFSFLPDLTDTQIEAQLRYCTEHGWALSVEHTDDPHPRNTYWEMWGLPHFDDTGTTTTIGAVMASLDECRRAYPHDYIRICAFDATKGWESLRTSFIVQRPDTEPGFRLDRSYRAGRSVGYAAHAYATDRPAGDRYR